jgi:hypothetical protein
VSDLPERAKKALERAAAEKLSYTVRFLRTPDGRILAILGEAHLKLGKAAEIGRGVVSSFELRGVETFQRKKIFLGRALGVLINVPRILLRIASLGSIKGSTITEAKQLPSGYTVELERTNHVPFGLHVTSAYMTAFFTVTFLGVLSPLLALISPGLAAFVAVLAVCFQAHALLLVPAILLRRYSWSWVVHPFLGILTLRDRLMAEGTVRMFTDHPHRLAVVVMGRAHCSGYARILVDEYGYVPYEPTGVR